MGWGKGLEGIDREVEEGEGGEEREGMEFAMVPL